MTKYCDVHGAVEVGIDEASCPMTLGMGGCSTTLKLHEGDLESNRQRQLRGNMIAEGTTPVQVLTSNAYDAETAGRQHAFLIAFEGAGIIGKAAKKAGISRQSHYNWLKDPDYERRFQQSMVIAFGVYEDEAINRAMTGSDRLMEKVLESLGPKVGRPEWARATKHEHAGPDGKPISLDVNPSEQLLSRIAGLVTGGSAPQGT